MGAWDYQILCSDTALDAMDELLESSEPLADIERFLDEAISCGGYIDADVGEYALAAAAVVNAKCSGIDITVLDNDDRGEDDEYLTFIRELSDCGALREKACKAVALVLSEESELRELWEENEELYEKWFANTEKIKNRLSITGDGNV